MLFEIAVVDDVEMDRAALKNDIEGRYIKLVLNQKELIYPQKYLLYTWSQMGN